MSFADDFFNSAEDQMTKEHIWKQVYDVLEQLPEEQANVFVWHELEGKSYEEIMVETGVPLNTLMSRKRYAILKLRTHLKELYQEILE